MCRRLVVLLFAFVAISTAGVTTDDSWAFDADSVFTPWQSSVSFQGSLAHFGIHLGQTGWVNAWNVSGRFSLLPFGVTRFNRLPFFDRFSFSDYFDGALEVGVGPEFERFVPMRQNFAGLSIGITYFLLHFEYGRFVPWIDASIAPGYTDLNIGKVSNETLLTGPFMNLIEAGIGGSYFVSDRIAIYAGLNAQHISNAGLNGTDRNFALNTPLGVVMGVSWYP